MKSAFLRLASSKLAIPPTLQIPRRRLNMRSERYVTIQAVLTVLTLMVAVPSAHAWSNEAHRVTAFMAQEMLTPASKAAVAELLDGTDLADASVYMDFYRLALKRELPGSDRWHFDNRSVCQDNQGTNSAIGACEDGNCASAQIVRWFGKLADRNNTKDERQLALRLLIHMVGDIHQPLHAADDNDTGGGKKMMMMPSAKLPQNLHLVWDVDLPKIAMRGLSEQQVAKDLLANHRPKFAEWMKGVPASWSAQSFGIAKRLAYGKLPGFSCGEVDGKPTGLLNGKPWSDEPLPLGREYVEGAVGIVPLLLAQAGARIGGLLNAALDPDGAKRPKPPQPLPAVTPPAPPAPPKTTSLKEALGR
jgi:hypothetical protein